MRSCLFIFVFFYSFLSYSEIKVSDCDASSMQDINWAIDHIDQNLNSFLKDASTDFLIDKYKDSYKKKWPNVKIKCSVKGLCKSGEFVGFNSGDNTIRLCWDELRSRGNYNRCDLVSTLIHELGHGIGIKINSKLHTHKTDIYDWLSSPVNNFRTIDQVYRIGDAANVYCQNISSGTGTPGDGTGTSNVETVNSIQSLDIGQKCSRGTQCRSNKCEKNECSCDNDNDCGLNRRCIKRLGKNYCLSTGAGPGDSCKKNSDCIAGKCEGQICTCNEDTDCTSFFGITNIRCHKVAFGKNYCQPTSVPSGEACTKDSDCSGSLKCKKDKAGDKDKRCLS